MVSADVSELHRVFGSAWKIFAGDHPHADLTDQDGIATAWADSPFVMWNFLLLNDILIDSKLLRQRLTEAIAFAKNKRFPGFVVLCEEYLSRDAKDAWPTIMEEFNLVQFPMSMTGMVSETVPQESSIPSLRLERVTSQKLLQDYSDINAEAHGMDKEACDAGIANSPMWKDRAYSYVGYIDERPVTTASVVVCDDTLYVALVATALSAQRKGYATAAMLRALKVAAHATGLKRTTLHATSHGESVYAQMGYQSAGKFNLYQIPPAES